MPPCGSTQRGDGRIPVFLDPKTNPLKGRQVEDLVHDVLAGRRVELPPDVVRFMLRRGGFLLLIDSLDEIDEQSRDDGLQPFLVRDADNWCVFAAQQPLLARAQVRLARVLVFTPARARAYLRKRLGEDMWDRLPEAAQTIAKVPKDLDLIADLLRSGQPEAIPTDRAGLYRHCSNATVSWGAGPKHSTTALARSMPLLSGC